MRTTRFREAGVRAAFVFEEKCFDHSCLRLGKTQSTIRSADPLYFSCIAVLDLSACTPALTSPFAA
jgi:hypothetical protein